MRWPALKAGPDREVTTVYPSHSAVPPTVWQSLVADAEREIVFATW